MTSRTWVPFYCAKCLFFLFVVNHHFVVLLGTAWNGTACQRGNFDNRRAAHIDINSHVTALQHNTTTTVTYDINSHGTDCRRRLFWLLV
jgi:hypothetical protein